MTQMTTAQLTKNIGRKRPTKKVVKKKVTKTKKEEPKKVKEPKYAGKLRLLSMEICKFNDEPLYNRSTKTKNPAAIRWRDASERIQMANNLIWQLWLAWHVLNGSRKLLKPWVIEFEATAKRLEKETGKRPEFEAVTKIVGDYPVEPVPTELDYLLRDMLTDEFTDINSRTLNLNYQKQHKLIKNFPAAKGSWPGWVVTILGRQNPRSYSHPQPIPFDIQNTRFIPPKVGKKKENHKMRILVSRIHEEGKARCESHPDVAELWCQGKKVASQLACLKKVISGEYKLCGSNIVFSNTKNKCFAQVAYRMLVDPRPDLNPTLVATLVPEEDHPLSLHVPERDKPIWIGGQGLHIGSMRERIGSERMSKAVHYKHASTNSRGRGRKRAMSWRQRLQFRWNNHVKNVDNKMTTKVVEILVEQGIGTLIYHQPTDEFAKTRFLSITGKEPEKLDEDGNVVALPRWMRLQTSWQWAQITSMLNDKCKKVGIVIKIEKKAKEMKVGDLVEAVPPFQLSCGDSVYKDAVVASVDPFVLVSQSGDMSWSDTIKQVYVRVAGKASKVSSEVMEIAGKKLAEVRAQKRKELKAVKQRQDLAKAGTSSD